MRDPVPQTRENMEVVWRFMRLQHAIGFHTFGWRFSSDDLIVLSAPSEGDDEKKEVLRWKD